MQQINLYTDDFRPKKVVLSLEQILLLPLITIVVLALLTYWLHLNLEQTKKDISEQESKKTSLQVRVDKLEARARLQIKDESLVAANNRLSETLGARQKMVGMLDTVVVKDDEGFSNILISLARQKITGLWIKEIHIGVSGKEMTLKGTTSNASAVPGYLQNLRKEASFVGRSFTLFELGQDAENHNLVDFTLRSELKLVTGSDQSVESILGSNVKKMEQK